MRIFLLVAGVVALTIAHGMILYYASSYAALSAAVVSSVIVLIAINHLGIFGALYARLRRSPRERKQ